MIPKLTEFAPKLVTTTFPMSYQKVPSRINEGNCMRWAYTAYFMFPKVQLWDNVGHAFIKYQGKFYDSEALEGVDDVRDLPTNRGRKLVSRRRSRASFEKWWAANNHVTPDWKQYRSLARMAVKKHA